MAASHTQGMDGSTQSDHALMQDYARGNAAAFEQLYARHQAALWRFVRHSCQNDATAAEVFQDTWMRVMAARQHYQPTAAFSTWLFALARHRHIDTLRKQGREQELDEALCDTTPAPAQHEPARVTQRHEQSRYLRDAIARLPLPQREAFLLQAEDDMTLADIAEVQGVGRETVKSRLRYALAALKKELADVWP